MNIGFVSGRLAGTDGVSLEAAKWADVLERMGHRVYYCAGELEEGGPPGMLVPEMYFHTEEADWIVEHAVENDIVITADIPLASRCVKKGARALSPRGRVFIEESIGDALANREIQSQLREAGFIAGGPAPFEKRDRSRLLQRLDEIIRAISRGKQ